MFGHVQVLTLLLVLLLTCAGAKWARWVGMFTKEGVSFGDFFARLEKENQKEPSLSLFSWGGGGGCLFPTRIKDA